MELEFSGGLAFGEGAWGGVLLGGAKAVFYFSPCCPPKSQGTPKLMEIGCVGSNMPARQG